MISKLHWQILNKSPKKNNTMLKRTLAIFAGMFASFVVISLLELAAAALFPIPQNIDFTDKEAVRQLMSNMPTGAMLFVLLGYAMGSFTGGVVTTLVSGRKQVQGAIAIGVLLVLGQIANILQMPGQPMWMIIASFLIYIPFAYAGFLVVRVKE